MSTTFPPVNQDGNAFHAGLPDSVTLSQSVYLASLDPRVLALYNMPLAAGAEMAARVATAQLLHAQGIAIDLCIVILQWDPATTMYLRQTSGLSWVYDAFGPSGGGSGAPPAGMLTLPVSTDANAFPPFAAAPVPPTPSTNLVGPQIAANLYETGPGVITSPASACNITDGEQVDQNGVMYTAHVSTGLMGISAYFTKN
jgi:hypothetical protein